MEKLTSKNSGTGRHRPLFFRHSETMRRDGLSYRLIVRNWGW